MRKPSILRFLSIIFRHSQVYYTRRLKPYGLKAGQYPFILAICHTPGVHQDDLCERMAIDKGTTAKAIQSLERAGYIERRVDESDRRANKLYATVKGEQLERILDGIIRDWRDILWRGFSKTEKDLAFDLSVRMAENARSFLSGKNEMLTSHRSPSIMTRPERFHSNEEP